MERTASDDAPPRGEFDRTGIHPIRLASGSRIVADSTGLGWRDAFLEITAERRWEGVLEPIPHLCVTYGLRRTATIERQVEDGPTLVAPLRPRRFAVIPTTARTRYRLSGTADTALLYLHGDRVEATARRLFGLGDPRRAFEAPIGLLDPLLEQLVLEMIVALHRRDPADAAYVDELAGLASAQLLRRLSRPANRTGADAAVLPARLGTTLSDLRRHIEEHIGSDLSLLSLSRVCGISPAAFNRAFVVAFGDTPHQYVIKRRIAATQRLLAGTDLPISEIALQTGFASQSHLSEIFKREIGETPRAYRRARND